MINWELLYDKFGHSLSASKFEDLALEYVRDVYNQYEWKPTKRTRDGNRDFHLLENEIYDIWGEAKYKKRGNTLSRKDLDPTILSGLIHGNVKLIIFITNAEYIPSSLIERIILGGKLKNISISCVLASQLNSWLIIHKNIYEKYFDEPLDECQIDSEIFQIQSLSFYNPFSQDFNPFELRYKMRKDGEYILSIVIYSNTQGFATIDENMDSPFIFIEHPNFNNPKYSQFLPGITTLTFLIKTSKEYTGCINMQILLNGTPFFYVTKELEIYSVTNYPIVYAKQLELNNQILHLINNVSDESAKYIITIYAESGMGKTHLLKNIYNNYMLKKDMTIVTFDNNQNSYINYLFLCRILLFLYYGNIFWLESSTDVSVQTRLEYKQIAIASNKQDVFSNVLLGKIIDGCYDANIAMGVINNLNKKMHLSDYILVHGHNSEFGKILILDDFQYLNNRQSTFMHHIIKQLKQVKNNNILIISATKNKFYNDELEDKFLVLTNNFFELKGLSFNDKKDTIGKNFNLPFSEIADSVITNLPDNILLISEIINSIKQYNHEIHTNTDYVIKYIENIPRTNIFQNRFEDLSDYYYLIDIIYRFKRGILKSYFLEYSAFNKEEVLKAFKILKNSHIIIEQGEFIKPYHDYLLSSYKNLRNKFFYNLEVERFLIFLLNKRNDNYKIDYNHILQMIIECNPSAYDLYECQIKKQMIKYNFETQFDVVQHFGKIIYARLKQKNRNELTDEDFYYLYLYGNSLIHCDNTHKACDILEFVYKKANKTSLEKYEAGVQLINERYWNAKPANIIEDSWILQTGIMQILQHNNKNYDITRLLKIYSSCINRRMVTYLLLEEICKAFDIYCLRLKELIQTYKNKYQTFSATLLMDYARGISYNNVNFSYTLLKLSLKYFYTNREMHYRRIPICELDLLVIGSIINGEYYENAMDEYIQQLLDGHFYSEYFKGVLKKCACKLIFTTQTLAEHGLNCTSISFFQEIIDEISNALIIAELHPSEREKFLMNNILAYIAIMQEDYNRALEYLEIINCFVKDIGSIYKYIAYHNFCNIYTINTIRWYSVEIQEDSNIFLLDPRFW